MSRLPRTVDTSQEGIMSSSNRPAVFARMPGALMVRFDRPAGTPDFLDCPVADYVRAASENVIELSEDEREAVFGSLVTTTRRARYHKSRFTDLRLALDERRAWAPGEMMWDELVAPLHFELQGLCAAARTAVDEIAYIAARRGKVERAAALRDPWEPSILLAEKEPAVAHVAEVKVLRRERRWFSTVNVYRNAFTHNGWRLGSGHLDPSDMTVQALHPARNALLLPDEASLKKSKPFEWTYHSRTTVDDVAHRAHDGLERILHRLCADAWGMPSAPLPGSINRAESPNAIVILPAPVVIDMLGTAILPIFSTEGLARAFVPYRRSPGRGELEIRKIRPTTVFDDVPRFVFSAHNVDPTQFNSPLLTLMVDPVLDVDGGTAKGATYGQVDLSDHVEGAPREVWMAPEGLSEAFVWVGKPNISWV